MTTSPRKRRRAVLMLSVLACLMLVMLLGTAWMKTIALARGQLRDQQNRVQAEYLAASALSRASARLASDPGYTGETLAIDADSLGSGKPAEVVIRVESAGDDPQTREVQVTAHYPAEGPDRASRSRQQRMTLSNQEGAP